MQILDVEILGQANHIILDNVERISGYAHVQERPILYGNRFATPDDNGKLLFHMVSGEKVLCDKTFEQFVEDNRRAMEAQQEVALRQQAAMFQKNPQLRQIFGG